MSPTPQTAGVFWPMPRPNKLLAPASETEMDRVLRLSGEDVVNCIAQGHGWIEKQCIHECDRERNTFPR